MQKYFLLFFIDFILLISHAQISVFADEKMPQPTINTSSIVENLSDDVVVINYSNLDSIQKFKKVEFGIDLAGDLENRIKEFLDPGSNSDFSPLNPFLEWDLDIKAEFNHQQTGKKKKRDFFYYHDYSVISNDWNDEVNEQNKHMMRVRFAPPLSGSWECKISIKVDNEIVYLRPFLFNVVENNHPGFVSVHSNKKNFKLGKKIVFPTGHVFPVPYNRVGGGKSAWGGSVNNFNPLPDPSRSNKNVTPNDWAQYVGDIKSYVRKGGKSIKIVQASYANLIEFEELGNYYGRMHYAWEQDKIIDFCEQHDVLINFNLMFQDVIMAYGQNQLGEYPAPWDYGPYGQEGEILNTIPWSSVEYNTYCYYVPGTLPSNMFLDTNLYNNQTEVDIENGHTLMSFHKQRIRYYVARYGFSPQIYTWELMSEPLHMDEFNELDKPAQDSTHKGYSTAILAINTYHDVISNYIKNELEDSEHLITLDIAPQTDIDYTTLDCAANNNIDVIGFNHYSLRPDKLVIAKPKHFNRSDDDKKAKFNLVWNHESETSVYRSIQVFRSHSGLEKPIILSEVGHSWDIRCEGKTGNIIDVMTFGFSGLAGMHIWSGYSYGDINEVDSRQLWESTISAEKHINSEKVIPVLNNWSGLWKQGRQTEKVFRENVERLKELQYYLSQNNELATGYVRNTSYNVWTARANNSCNPLVFTSPLNAFTSFNFDSGKRKLYVKGLQSKVWYKVYWYSFLTGELFRSDIQKSDNSHRLELKYPPLILTNPIWWFKIEKISSER